MFLSETWLQKKGWERVRRWLSKGYIWEMQETGKRNKKGRAMGEMVIEKKEGIETKREDRVGEDEKIMTRKVNLGGEWWRLVGVHVNKDLEEKMERLKEWMENREKEVKVLIRGDFNAREEKGEKEVGEEKRKLRGEKINRKGRKLCGFLGELGWSILNGNVEGDEKGEWMYTEKKGGSVIDYCVRK